MMNDLDKGVTDKLRTLQLGLQSNDPAVCGAAPSWIVDAVLNNLENVTKGLSPAELDCNVKGLALGAIKYVADQGVAGCDVLLGRLSELLATVK
jgi:hypothetical protein